MTPFMSFADYFFIIWFAVDMKQCHCYRHKSRKYALCSLLPRHVGVCINVWIIQQLWGYGQVTFKVCIFFQVWVFSELVCWDKQSKSLFIWNIPNVIFAWFYWICLMCVKATSELTSDDPESELFIKYGYLPLIVLVPKWVQITDNWEEANN